VCPYVYTHPELFQLHRPLAPLIWQAPSLRISLDTPEDYRRAQVLFEVLAAYGEERFQGETIIAAYRRGGKLLTGALP
jgi:spore coat polysaccharide biosynthesis protein SpsF